MNDLLNSKKQWNNTVVKYWQENLRPPWRPSPDDIENYRRGIKMLKKPIKNILVLGATPELRVLANQLGGRVWLTDQSYRMFKEMGKLIPSLNSGKEKYLISNWCNLKILREKSFDVILGDLVLRLIPPKKQLLFLENICRLLSSKGLFITRIHFVNQSLTKSSCEKIINDAFLLLDPAIPGRGTSIKNLLISRILDKNSFAGNLNEIKRNARLDIKNYLAVNLGISANRKQILKGALNRFEKRRLANFFPQTKKEIEKSLRNHFRIKKRLIANDCKEAKYFPVYVLKLYEI